MSNMTLLYFAVAVFVLMGIGLLLTAIEFRNIAHDPDDREKPAK